jgi:sugar/nucleoside kinase (ribokinase family)
LSSIAGLYHNGYKHQVALFAAGFLFGLARDAGYENAGRLGALAAAEVIQHIGARPQVSLKELAQQNGLPV